jgi:hypothetical protein
MRNIYKTLARKLEGKNYMEDLSRYRRMILK